MELEVDQVDNISPVIEIGNYDFENTYKYIILHIQNLKYITN